MIHLSDNSLEIQTYLRENNYRYIGEHILCQNKVSKYEITLFLETVFTKSFSEETLLSNIQPLLNISMILEKNPDYF